LFYTGIVAIPRERKRKMSEHNLKSEHRIFSPSSLCQIGVVVRSIDETIRYYQESFGFGPFEIREVDYPTATYYGETAGYRGKRAFFHLGPIQVELIELKDGKTIHESFLQEKGEGLHHIGFLVPDLEEGKKRAEGSGLKVIQGFTRPDGTGFAYLDSDKAGGVIFELIQRQKKNTA
jgi:catechol 2,3-dioxygenase-like lactoylglutathione lyase family enzyme